MKHTGPTPHVAFQPPADMVGDTGGSSAAKKAFVGVGIGCGLVLIVIGLLFAAGAFEAIKCCNQFKGIAEGAMGAEQFADGFADDIWQGRLDVAYAKTSKRFQSDTSSDGFMAAIEAHRERMNSNQPRMFGMQLEQSGGEKPSLDELATGTWMMSYQFAGARDETMLLLNFRVAQVEAAEGEEAFAVSDIKFDERVRNLQHEPPAEEVLKVHDTIQRGQYEMAYSRLGDGFRTGTDRDAWRKFLEDVGPLLTQSTLEIREVSYNDSNTQATVMTHAKTTSGQDAIVQFELLAMQPEMPGFGWRVVSIAPIVAEVTVDGPKDAVPPMPDGASTNGATNGATPEPAVKPPAVEADFD